MLRRSSDQSLRFWDERKKIRRTDDRDAAKDAKRQQMLAIASHDRAHLQEQRFVALGRRRDEKFVLFAVGVLPDVLPQNVEPVRDMREAGLLGRVRCGRAMLAHTGPHGWAHQDQRSPIL
ncbi:hypothetical protein A9Q02_09215 [Candidatus Chloroploca asiatica]|uniref:Uncharacterized protein n=1 Tax=Candidatus Chloroploca asiatica TaxID=1506545 RepID=A0A2H3KQG5_9CHLR|nr:hypothetical protein A9Q02_09215 [Candidatus Chloroploca asiatica]